MNEKHSQDNLQMINFRITPEEAAKLDQIAADYGITRSQLIRNMITLSIDEYYTFKKVGIVRAALTIRDILDWMADKAKSSPETVDKDNSSKA